MKLQIGFRDTTRDVAGHHVFLASGIVEVDTRSARDMADRFVSLRMDFAMGGQPICCFMTGHPSIPRLNGKSREADVARGDIERILTMQLDRELPGAMSNLEIFTRPSRIEPSAAGYSVMVFSGLLGLKAPISADVDNIHQLETPAVSASPSFMSSTGMIGVDINPDWGHPVMVERTAGLHMRSYLRSPVWGFGAEPVTPVSTLSLDLQDRLCRFDRLHLSVRNWSENREYARLRKEMEDLALDDIARESEFAAIMRVLDDAGFLEDRQMPRTATQVAERTGAISAAIRRLKADPAEIQFAP